jgi:hypothetical protein
MNALDICIFCVRHQSCTVPWCPDNPGRGCTYGYGHEYPLPQQKTKQTVAKKLDAKLCTPCGLHPKNPKSDMNGCTHVYG